MANLNNVPRIVFIDYPETTDLSAEKVEEKLLKIVEECNTAEVFPFFPQFLQKYWNYKKKEEKERMILFIAECFSRGLIDEVWLYGEKLPDRMKFVIDLALRHNIKKIVGKTQEIQILIDTYVVEKEEGDDE